MGWVAYDTISDLLDREGSDVARVRLLGMPVICMRGLPAVHVFYDESRFQRRGVLPGFAKKTLFGVGGVQGLDDGEHRARKAMFLSVGTPGYAEQLAMIAGGLWRQAARRWAGMPRVALFDESALVLTRAVTAWAHAPLPAAGAAALAENLTTMVDGFATLGARHWRGRMARARAEMWAGKVIGDVRAGGLTVSPASVVHTVAHHRDASGVLMPERVAGVELLNIIRPTVAVAWFVTFIAHALHHHPEWRQPLRDGDRAVSRAFAQEARRFYPFAPFVGARVRHDFVWEGQHFDEGRLVLLDIYGTNHSPTLWREPETFDPQRFLGTDAAPQHVIAQGGGEAGAGHRCPGEDITLRLMAQAAEALSNLDYRLPPQDLGIPLDRIPTRPRSGVILERVREPVAALHRS
ncbi:cytochrome P450 [Allorhizocola rhizosphaerae]|uniref:cytochrome P450 n=1 Tax=Allorhizocola rhizosphaerae TaxID=1872709 RepID=UPI000E3CAF74|nr:cytochrome P450 [Allorhizocola rhizosphaerae]